jgi:hypothetical protein
MEGIKGVFSVQTSSPRGEISDEQEIIQEKPLLTVPWRPESAILFILLVRRSRKRAHRYGTFRQQIGD